MRRCIADLFLLAALHASAAEDRPQQTSGIAAARIDARLAGMTLELTKTRPYRFILRYHGERMGFEGPVCYAFLGYNETCLEPKVGLLTPQTRLALHAPGGVPRELLRGYELVVRFPLMSFREFRYRLVSENPKSAASRPTRSVTTGWSAAKRPP